MIWNHELDLKSLTAEAKRGIPFTGDPDQVDEPFDYDQELADQHPEGLSRKDQMVSHVKVNH